MIRRRREEEHQGKSSHERWLVSYADFITLLFGFFVVMYSVSQVSEQKYRVLSETLSNVFHGNTNQSVDREIGHANPLDNQGKISGLSPQVNLVDTQVLARDLQEALIHLVQPHQVRISATEEWVQIDLNANVLFDSASADLKPEARDLFRQIAVRLAPFDNEIEVSGHTDNLPIRTNRFHSNWELSSARASAAVRLLAEDGIDPHQLSAVGYGEYRPVADNATEEGRLANRRVVLMVARHAVERQVVPLDEIDPPTTQVLQPPLAPVAEETPGTEEAPVTDETRAPEAAPPAEGLIEPVRLKNGGLLFTRDPAKD